MNNCRRKKNAPERFLNGKRSEMSFRSTYRCGERRESHRDVYLCTPSGRKNQTHPPCMRGRLQREPSRATDGNRAASGAVSVPAFAFVTDSLLHRGFRERLCLPGRISFRALHPRPPRLPAQAPFLPLVPPLPISPFGGPSMSALVSPFHVPLPTGRVAPFKNTFFIGSRNF